MEKRYAKRITAGFRTEILYKSNTYTGVIENLSASGANILTDTLDASVEFIDDDIIDLRFESPSGETVNLKCKIMWSSPIPPHNVRHRIGVSLIERPWEKLAFFL